VHIAPRGIFLQSMCTPTPQEILFMLKHVRKIFPSQDGKHIAENQATSMLYLKVLDIHAIGNDCKTWSQETAKLFKEGLKLSLAGQGLAKRIKNSLHIMRNSRCSDMCTVWVDIHDMVSGSFARGLIGQFIPIASMNCCIAGAKPHVGLLQCTRCLKWGHHYSRCHALAVWCPLCTRPHTEANHSRCVAPTSVERCRCLNCASAKRGKHNHASTDRKCLFWQHRFDCDWHKHQFKHD
jgi:hypothetical protein